MQNFYLLKKEFFYRLDSFVLPATIINTMEFLIPEFGLLFWTLLAFLIVFFILKKFAWPAIVKGLTDRENSIAESLATAEKVKNEMAQLKNDNEALLVKAREERAQLLKEAKEIKDKIVNDAKDEAKAQASKIIADAQATIHQQKMAALTDLKNQIGNLVIETSEKVLRKELSNKAEQENYIKTLAGEVKLN
jgi:F-type H+-transporting ATPase subunit b